MEAIGRRDLVGRESELERLHALLGAIADLPTVIALIGEPGIGKTALAQAAATAAADLRYLVKSTRASETEAPYSFAGLSDLATGIVEPVLPELPRPQRRALESALALSGSAPAAEEGAVAFAFLRALRAVAASRPVLLLIDDAQWLDAASDAVLRFAAARLEAEAVALIFTYRDEAPSWLGRAVAAPRLHLLELPALSLGAVREILRARLGLVLPRPLLMRILTAAGGNPFFALEIAAALQRTGRQLTAADELPVSRSLEALVAQRLAPLDGAALEMARIVALLANPSASLLAVAGVPESGAALSALFDNGVLAQDGERVRFSHPILRSVVARGINPPTRRRLHASLAGLVRDPEERARQLALATTGPDETVAATLEAAADQAAARGASAAALELSELAVSLTPVAEIEAARTRRWQLAARLGQAGDGKRALKLLKQVCAEIAEGPSRAAALLRWGAAESEFGDPRVALGALRQALAEAGADDALRVEIHLRLADLIKVNEGGRRALASARLAVEASERSGDPSLRREALGSYAFLSIRLGLGAPAELDQALALERQQRLAVPGNATTALGYLLVWSPEADRARALFEPLAEALADREEQAAEWAFWNLALVEWRAGNWGTAWRYAIRCLDWRAQFGMEGGQAAAQLPAALVEAHQGRIDEARARSERALARAASDGSLIEQSGHLGVLGFIELSLGRPDAALQHLRAAWELRDVVEIFEPGHRLELADTLEALIAVGELEDAERRMAEWERRSRRLGRPWALAITLRARGLLLAARGDAGGAARALDRALAEHARAGDPFQRARTLLALGMTQRRSRQRRAARATLADALAEFDRLGAPLWAARASGELDRIGGRNASLGELTDAEARIAALVAQGRTNKETAAALFITEHTVEGALTRAYQKLGVRSRAQLVSRLRAGPTNL